MKNQNNIFALAALLAMLAFFVSGEAAYAFDYSTSAIDTSEIRSGGPGKDGIPSLTSPKFIKAKEASYLKGSDSVIGITLGGQAKAYPVKVLSWHEAVNDSTGPIKFLVTW
jgi:hypothetical protein